MNARVLVALAMLGCRAPEQDVARPPVPVAPPSSVGFEVLVSPNVETLGAALRVGFAHHDVAWPNPLGDAIWKPEAERLRGFGEHEGVSSTIAVIQQDLGVAVSAALCADTFPSTGTWCRLGEYETRSLAAAGVPGSAYTEALAKLHDDADVAGIMARNRDSYRSATTTVEASLPGVEYLEAMSSFYGTRFDRTAVVVSLLLPPGLNVGPTLHGDRGSVAYYVVTPSRENERGDGELHYDFDPDTVDEVAFHEFGHSFIDGFTERYASRLAAIESLQEPILAVMTEQTYGRWTAIVEEHVVRLGEIRVARALGLHEREANLRQEYFCERRFIYLPLLEARVVDYEANRDRYPRFADFLPELVAALEHQQESGAPIDDTYVECPAERVIGE